MTEKRFDEIRRRKYAEDRVVWTVFYGDEEATALNIVNDDDFFVAYMRLGKLYETREQAEWHCKIDAARTERFEPPMWEEIESDFTFRFIKDGIDYIFTVDKKYDLIGIDSVYDPRFEEFNEPATKENYEKACEMVRGLFKGEK